jgi:hypothetical protein
MMNQHQQQALEAAMLAKMVGSELNKVDGLTIEKGPHPANKIDINRFIAPIKSGQPLQNEANMGYMPEAMVQKMVPDNTSPGLTVGTIIPSSQQVQNFESIPSEDIKIIKSHLERINSNLTKLTGMFGKIFCNILEKEKSNIKCR